MTAEMMIAWANFLFSTFGALVNIGYILLIKQTSIKLIKSSKVVILMTTSVVYCMIIQGAPLNPLLLMFITMMLLLSDAISGAFRFVQAWGLKTWPGC